MCIWHNVHAISMMFKLHIATNQIDKPKYNSEN
jgi:hypothetical protein